MLHKRIKDLRVAKGITQDEMAERLHVVRQTVSKWENGLSIPDAEMLLQIALLFDVPVSDLIEEAPLEKKEREEDCAEKGCEGGNPSNKKRIRIACIALCAVLAVVFVFGGINRTSILYPDGRRNHVEITGMGSTQVETRGVGNVLFDVLHKPKVICVKPVGFYEDESVKGLYKTKTGEYIQFDSAYAKDVVHPLTGTDYYTYYKEIGIEGFIESARYALSKDIQKIGLLSSRKEIYLAGGARRLRFWLCADQDASYYAIDGTIKGYALHLKNSVWKIAFEDHNGYVCYVTIKVPEGIGKSIEEINKYLAYIKMQEE